MTAAVSRASRSTPAPTSCSARVRTSYAASELYRHRLIAYSLGNLAGYHNFSTAGLSGLSALLTIAVTADGRFANARIHPLALDAAARPHHDPRRRTTTLIRRLTMTDFVGGGLRIDQRGRVSATTDHRVVL